MPLSLRPYVTAGVAVAGASVIAIASIQPTPPDVHIPNPVAEVARDVQLTANVTLPSIETQYNDLVLPVTELGLSLTVPPTAAVINAIAPDLIPEGSTAEAVATGLLLRLSGYAISGVGSIGTALQRVIVGFGCPSTGGLCEDLGTGYRALLVGAPSTIIDGFVNGGYGRDLEPLLFGTDTSRVISAGGLINPGALPPPLGGTTEPPFILPGTFPTLQGLAERLLVSDLNDFGGLLGDLLGGLVDNLLGSFGPTTALPSIETQYNDLVLPVTELGLSLTVPPAAAVINAIAPDLIPEGSTAEAVATGLLLRLSGYAISGVGSIGTALQRVIVGFGCPSTGGLCEDLGTGYLALLVGAPSTIIDGFVNGGYGPDLEPLLFGTDTSRDISAGGLINPGALPPPLGGTTEPPFILPGTFPTLQGLAERPLVSDLNDLGGLLGGLLDNLPGLSLLGSSDSAALTSVETISIDDVDTSNENLVKVDLPAQGEEARRKHAAPDTTLAAPLKSFRDQAAGSAQKLAGALEAPRTRNSHFGEAVKAAGKPDSALGGTTVGRDSLSFVPEPGKKKNGGNSGKSNPASTKISSTVKGFGDAVKHAVGLGGGSTDSDGE